MWECLATHRLLFVSSRKPKYVWECTFVVFKKINIQGYFKIGNIFSRECWLCCYYHYGISQLGFSSISFFSVHSLLKLRVRRESHFWFLLIVWTQNSSQWKQSSVKSLVRAVTLTSNISWSAPAFTPRKKVWVLVLLVFRPLTLWSPKLSSRERMYRKIAFTKIREIMHTTKSIENSVIQHQSTQMGYSHQIF